MNTELITEFEQTFKDVEPKEYPIHYHGHIEYFMVDDFPLSTEKLLQSYDNHADTLGI